jgi:hypothetical protein
MKQLDRWIIRYVTTALIPVIVLLAWGSISDPDKLSMSQGATRLFWDTLGWVFMIWIVAMLYLILKMVFRRGFRETVLSKIAHIKARDEREELISGEAAKFSILSTMAIMFLILFFSLFTLTVGKYPEGTRGYDKHGFISVGMNFYPFSKDAPVKETRKDGQEIFNYNGLPLSSSLIMIIMILWQLGSYQIIAMRMGREN